MNYMIDKYRSIEIGILKNKRNLLKQIFKRSRLYIIEKRITYFLGWQYQYWEGKKIQCFNSHVALEFQGQHSASNHPYNQQKSGHQSLMAKRIYPPASRVLQIPALCFLVDLYLRINLCSLEEDVYLQN